MRITKAQYKGLDGYKYSGTDKSVVSLYILGPFWNWLVLLFPTNLAPNMVCLDYVVLGMGMDWAEIRLHSLDCALSLPM